MQLEENDARIQSEWEAEERNNMAYRSQPAAQPDQGVFESLECNNTMHMAGYMPTTERERDIQKTAAFNLE